LFWCDYIILYLYCFEDTMIYNIVFILFWCDYIILYLYCFEDTIIYNIVFILFWYTCSFITDTDLKMSCCSLNGLGVRVMVLNDTFNNILVISWQSVLLMEKTRVPGENHRPVTDKLCHIMLYLDTSRHEWN
jgi:hypothetical protein